MKSIARTVFLLSICAGVLLAQSGATIGGTVLDQAVTLKSESGDTVREVKTGDDGRFSAAGLNADRPTQLVAGDGGTNLAMALQYSRSRIA